MKKRILALVSAVVLVLSMSMTAFATPSVEVGDTTVTDKDGNPVDEGIIKVVYGISGQYDAALTSLDFDDVIAGTEYADSEWTKVQGVEIVEVGDADGLYPITVAFDADDFAGEPLVLAYIDGEWVIVELKLVDGKYQVTLDGETALLFYEKVTASTGTTEGESPKTGDTTSFVWVALAAVAAATVVLVERRKRA